MRVRNLFLGVGLIAILIGAYVFQNQREPDTSPQGVKRTVQGATRGYLTTPQELEEIRRLADLGIEPFQEHREDLLLQAESPSSWDFGIAEGEFRVESGRCVSDTYPDGDEFIDVSDGAHEVYRKVLAYYLTQNTAYAVDAREKILDLTDTHTFGGEVYSGSNECILHLAFAIPLWIQSADLLEDTSIWTQEDKRQFQDWLARDIYRKVAWASRERINNWGSAGSLSASMIADYLSDRNIELQEIEPRVIKLTPAEAYTQHNQLQLDRMNGRLQADSECSNWGIQSYGGIPDELRRGSTGCDGQWIQENDSSLSYTTLQIEHLVFHAEYLSRRGDFSLYEQGGEQKLLLTAINFVIDNPVNPDSSFDWHENRKGTLYVAYNYYQDTTLLALAQTADTFKSGGTLPYAQVTHSPLPQGHRPPVVSPPE